MKLNKQHFEKFKKYCNKWQIKLGLTNYEFRFEFENIDEALARIWTDNEGRVAYFTFSTYWGTLNPTDKNIEMTAFHEVCEILLDDFCNQLDNRGKPRNEIDRMVHDVIRRLENLIFNNDK